MAALVGQTGALNNRDRGDSTRKSIQGRPRQPRRKYKNKYNLKLDNLLLQQWPTPAMSLVDKKINVVLK
ncbi:hypothetical protein BGX27_007291, partial [Mortierella sp. AM989]